MRPHTLTAVNGVLAWLEALTLAGVSLTLCAGKPGLLGYFATLGVIRAAALAMIVTLLARRGSRLVPVALAVLALVQVGDGLSGVLWEQWGQLSAFAMAAIHGVSAWSLRYSSSGAPEEASTMRA